MRAKTQKQQIIGLKELRENMETYIRKVARGESITVFRRSTPIFRLSPVDTEETGWDTVADFTKIDRDGVSARDVLSALRKLDG